MTVYTDEIAKEALDLLAQGKTLRKTAESLGVHYPTLWNWVNTGHGLFVHSPRARDAGFDAIADECADIADRGDLDAQDRKVRIDTRLRLLGQWSKRYGKVGTVDLRLTKAEEMTDDELAAICGSAGAIAPPSDPRIPD